MQRIDTSTGEVKLASPNYVSQYWAQQRTNAQLLSRSETPESTLDAYLAELEHILESSILIYPQTLLDLDLTSDLTYKEKKEALGLSIAPPVQSLKEKRFSEFLERKALAGRKAAWNWRIAQEVEEKQKAGWYPFFVTLTLDPSLVEKEYESTLDFWQKGREWRRWLRSLVKVVCDELGHPPAHKRTKLWPYRPESNYLTYVGVIEHGKSREHHHAHVLVWLREIPDSWKQDPNRYIANPKKRINRRCRELETKWKWSRSGLSPANYFRCKGDVWSMLGHGYPVDEKTGKPVIVGGPRQAASYVTKYLQKEHKEWKHRIKATRNLGMLTIKKQIEKLDNQTVEALTYRPENQNHLHSVSMIHGVPVGLVRSIATQIDFSRKLKSEKLSYQDLMNSNCGVYIKMLKSVQDGARPDRMHSLDFYDWVCRHLPGQKGYSKDRLIEAHEKLRELFPRKNIHINSIVLGGNDGFASSIQDRSTSDRESGSRVYRTA